METTKTPEQEREWQELRFLEDLEYHARVTDGLLESLYKIVRRGRRVGDKDSAEHLAVIKELVLTAYEEHDVASSMIHTRREQVEAVACRSN